MTALQGKRIVVVGVSGSGKTTLARRLAAKLGFPYFEADSLYWSQNWTPVPFEVFRERIEQALSEDAWVIDGNYNKVRPYIWSQATVLVWLDYSLPVIMGRLVRRTTSRVFTREELWSGNRESLKNSLMSKNSIFLWAFQAHGRYRRTYPDMLAQPENAHLQIIRLKSPRAAAQWLDSINI